MSKSKQNQIYRKRNPNRGNGDKIQGIIAGNRKTFAKRVSWQIIRYFCGVKPHNVVDSMKRILDYVLGSIYLLYFGILLLVFHVIQVICFRLFGRAAHQASVNWLNFFIVKGWWLTGSHASLRTSTTLPTDRPIIFVALS